MLSNAARMNFFVKIVAPRSIRPVARFLNLSRWMGAIFICTTLAANAADPTGVKLAWNPSPDPSVTGYRIHYGVSPAQYTNSIAVGNVTSATVSGLVNGVTYYFTTTAYNSSDIESLFSNEISYQPAFSLLQVRINLARQPVLNIQGQGGHSYEIQATQNLTDWTVLGTATPNAGGNVEFTDAGAASFPSRFYRLRDTTL